MPRRRINDIELYYELTGDGPDTVVLVHGGWTDHLSWRFVAPTFAERYRVLGYDRRGHSRSERPPTPSSRRHDEDDLADLIETLDLGSVHLVGNSYGGSISLGLAARRPELVRSVIAHEPPLLGVGRACAPLLSELSLVNRLIADVGEMLHAGDLAGSARHFVDAVALGPGAWQTLPEETRRTMVANAATFLDLLGDPHWDDVPESTGLPVMLTDGDASPTWLPAIAAALAATTYRHAHRHTFLGAGHVPHLTHPGLYVPVVESFIAATGTGAPTRSSTGSADSAARKHPTCPVRFPTS
jgi:pimeloyl-ACP methyl ester carboxylesterase